MIEVLYQRITQSLSVGDLYKVNEIPDLDFEKDWYSSIFFYNEQQKEQFYQIVDKLNNSDGTTFKGKNGSQNISNVITNRLVWDFDSKDNINDAKKDCIVLLERLNKDFNISKEYCEISFSGSKGFGVELTSDNMMSPQQLKQFCQVYAKGLKTFDESIYKYSQPLRITGTKHPKSGLYKTQISLKELNSSLEEIKEIASQSYLTELKRITQKINRKFLVIEEKKEEHNPIENNDSLDMTTKPNWISNWRYALMKGWFPSGCRNTALMILASTCKAQGLPPEITHRILKGSVELQAKRHNQAKYDKNQIWLEIVTEVYKPGWRGGVYSEDNFPDKLKEYFNDHKIERYPKDQINDETFTKIDVAFNDFIDYAKNIDENTLTFGLPELDKKLKVRMGHLVGILAPPAAGKTSLLITFLNNLSVRKIPSLFFSLDMFRNTVIEKLLIRETGKEAEEIYEIFKSNNVEEIERLNQLLKDNYKYVDFCFKSSQSMDELKRAVYEAEKRQNEKVKLVGVDYLELVRATASDPTQASAEIIQGLRELANDGRVVVCLLQPRKTDAKPFIPLLEYTAAKGSSAIAQAVTSMITCHRPGMSSLTPELDDFFCVNVVKNRMGPLSSVDFHWHGLTGKIRELTDSERETLKEIRSIMTNKDNGDI